MKFMGLFDVFRKKKTEPPEETFDQRRARQKAEVPVESPEKDAASVLAGAEAAAEVTEEVPDQQQLIDEFNRSDYQPLVNEASLYADSNMVYIGLKPDGSVKGLSSYKAYRRSEEQGGGHSLVALDRADVERNEDEAKRKAREIMRAEGYIELRCVPGTDKE